MGGFVVAEAEKAEQQGSCRDLSGLCKAGELE